MRFKTKDGEEVYFDENGEAVAKYEVINWQPSKKRHDEFVTVGLYDASLPVKDRLVVNMDSIVWATNVTQVRIKYLFFSLPKKKIYIYIIIIV